MWNKIKSLVCVISLLMQCAMANVTGPNGGGTFGMRALTGSSGSWNNAGNVVTSDNIYSDCAPLNNSPSQQYSNYLQVTNFQLNVPSGAIINGIVLTVQWLAPSAKVNDYSVRLIQGSTLSPNDKGNNLNLPSARTTTTFGGTTDMWGTAWTDLNINASNFGSLISVRRDLSGSGTGTANVDYVTITVYYTPDPMPIELVYFDAIAAEGKVKTEWETMSEINNDFFTIERGTKDKGQKIQFQQIGKMKGAGNSTSILNYQFIDDKPQTLNNELQTIIYYRLKQTDFDGKYTYSRTVAVELKQGTQTAFIYPNPANDKLNIIIGDGNKNSTTIKIYDVAGKVVFQSLIFSNKPLITLDISMLPQGIYFIPLCNEYDIRYVKFVKK